ncbi:uncharacterized protein UV8b_05717 [Ustilaginoidea virens]|uniref:Transmembrane protein n=2 Tax=Ustilaginoidea virens TaxID=1159556 RepID=A0A8E5HTX6_USTVR|nr:uncharacterized protein UV8b_05717 [Ustilaginoidea virens]QUC21474.1 hypothetical protein UV8b_05717 [Ustilaginoidea virens]
MRPRSENPAGSQWSDSLGSFLRPETKPPCNPFSDPGQEAQVNPLRDFHRGSPPPSLRTNHEAFGLEHPSGKASRHGPCPKPALEAADSDSDSDSDWDTVPAEGADAVSARWLTKEGQDDDHDAAAAAAAASGRAVCSNIFALQTRLHPPNPARSPGDHLPWLRASSVYDDGTDSGRDSPAVLSRDGDDTKAASKKRPATLGFDRTGHRGDAAPSYSKSSSRASVDPFGFDGDRYSPFLQPAAEREIGRALCQQDSCVPSAPSSGGEQTTRHTRPATTTTTTVPVLRRAPLSPTADEHPLSELDMLVRSTCEGRREADADWQTVTTEQAPVRALELTLRLDDAGSSIADVSDVTEPESLDQFVGQTPVSQAGRRHGSHAPPPRGNTTTTTSTACLRAPYPRLGSSGRLDGQPCRRRAAAAMRRLSSRLSHEARATPGLSRLSELRRLATSYASLDSQELLGHAAQPPPPTDSLCRSRGFAACQDVLHEAARARFPFPLISLPEAAALQSTRRERGEEDHTDPGPAFAAKARSCTISTTTSTTGPRTPVSPVEDLSSLLPRPKSAFHRHQPTQAFEYTHGQLNSSSILDHDVNASFFRTSVPRSTSLLSARFFRLGGVPARTRERRVEEQRPNDRSYLTASQTDLLQSAREDILDRRRNCRLDEDKAQRSIFLAIMVLTIFFPLVGLLALCGNFDGTISWYAKGERGCLTREQRGTLKQQLFVECLLYPGLIIALSVHYSVRK